MAESSPETPQNDWYAPDVATFGDRLAGAREAAGLTQADLAQRLGVRLTTLQNWEEDLAEPRGNRLQMLAGMLNVSIGWLLTAEGDGLAGPVACPIPLTPAAEATLADLRRMRARALELAEDLAQLERDMRQAMRSAA
ncbi:helix-turn-helix transcriptional regulator [Tabrizicola sp. YIM 78059]|uniref:helix-turn-helix domain-containing protein n=1 Tax=Tabrizicola sp. YIM 78059 TaxID=2529861 RepID=UPI0010AA901B|nr:helix-turn-helix transcriptional regulator [Tabrizicola sp. YIM 78059]